MKIKTSTWIIILVVVVSLVIIMLVVSVQPQNRQLEKQPPTTGTGIILDQPISADEFPYVGIKQNDTIAVFNSKEEVVIGLVRNRWFSPKWSPDRTYVAVMGFVGFGNDVVADIFVYELATNEWTRATFFSDAPPGVTGFDWLNNEQLVFSQGEIPENWVHTYDIKGRELKKIFRVGGSLEVYQPKQERYIVRVARFEQETDPIYQVLNASGSAINVFDSKELPENYNIERVITGRTENEYLVQAVSGVGQETFIWSFDSGEYRLLERVLPIKSEDIEGKVLDSTDVIYICAQDSNLLLAYTPSILLPGVSSLLNVNPELKTNKKIAVLEFKKDEQLLRSKSYCSYKENIISTKDDQNTYWRSSVGSAVTRLGLADGYTAVDN